MAREEHSLIQAIAILIIEYINWETEFRSSYQAALLHLITFSQTIKQLNYCPEKADFKRESTGKN